MIDFLCFSSGGVQSIFDGSLLHQAGSVVEISQQNTASLDKTSSLQTHKGLTLQKKLLEARCVLVHCAFHRKERSVGFNPACVVP